MSQIKQQNIMYKLVSLFFLVSFVSFGQQSRGFEERPANVPIGNLYKGNNVISGVPAYIWHRGGGPTALGMVIGYYNLNGFPDLFPDNETTQTDAVNNSIASYEHFVNYASPVDYYPNIVMDRSENGDKPHQSNSIADFMKTSFSSMNNCWGWSWSNDVSTAFEEYVAYKSSSYSAYSDYEWYNSGSWKMYKSEIDNNRPVVILADSDGNGYTDHFVVGVGYNEMTNEYGVYDLWDQNVHWYTWQGMGQGIHFGIFGFNKFYIEKNTPGIVAHKSNNKTLVKILDYMGRETTFKPNTSLIYVYDDGSTEKVFRIE